MKTLTFYLPNDDISVVVLSRIIVRIDSWEADSLYPSGHFVRCLGPIDDIETEIATILYEHGLFRSSFSEGIQKEMPINTQDNPWLMDGEEMKNRRDLR